MSARTIAAACIAGATPQRKAADRASFISPCFDAPSFHVASFPAAVRLPEVSHG
jgi:hypothetical protein